MKLSRAIRRFVDLFYIKPIGRFIPPETFRYVFCAGANVALGWLIYRAVLLYVVAGRWLDLGFVVMTPHIQALFIQLPITFLVGFWLMRYVAFRRSNLTNTSQLWRYLLQYGGSFLLNYLFMKLFVEVFYVEATVAKPLTDIAVALYSYLMSKFFTFRRRKIL